MYSVQEEDERQLHSCIRGKGFLNHCHEQLFTVSGESLQACADLKSSLKGVFAERTKPALTFGSK